MSRADTDFDSIAALSDFLTRHGITDIIHLAASANPAGGSPEDFYEANAFLTERLLQACEVIDLPGRFVLASATAVYGQGSESMTESSLLRPTNHYAASKVLAETFVGWRNGRLDTAIVRPSNCIGRGQKENYIAAKLVAAFRDRANEIVLGDTSISRDFVDVRDAADVFVRALVSSEAAGRTFNASSGKSTSIREIIDRLERLTGHRPEILQGPRFFRKGDVTRQVCANDAAKSIGHVPTYTLDQSLEWMLEA